MNEPTETEESPEVVPADDDTKETESVEAQIVPAEPVEVEAVPQESKVPQPTDIVVVAKDPEEMALAQKNLITWADQKVAALEAEVKEAEENLALATKRKWATTAFKKMLATTTGRFEYYKRIKAALEAGYVIIPDMPAETIAVRTSQHGPRRQTHKSNWSHRGLPSAASDGSEVGKGKYISPVVDYETWSNTLKGSNGQERTEYLAKADHFNDFSFPVTLVKPQVLEETSRAMLHKIFDEIGILGAGSAKPGEKLKATYTTPPDPIILGRVVRYEGLKRIACAFLITWWLDTKTL